MQSYALQRRLSHADVDVLGELKVAALLGLFEQAAVEASTAAGYDAAWYMDAGRIWIIRRTRLERLIPVGGSQLVEIDTTVLDFRRARSLRGYEVRRDGELVARATTDWVYCDMQTGRPSRVPADMQSALFGASIPAPLPRPESVPLDPGGPSVDWEITIQPSHLDHVAHVNNAVYANFLEDGAFALFAAHGWPLARMLAAGGALRVRRLDAEYFADTGPGDRLTVQSWLDDSAKVATGAAGALSATRLLQRIVDASGREVMRADCEWIWRQRPRVIGHVPD